MSNFWKDVNKEMDIFQLVLVKILKMDQLHYSGMIDSSQIVH
jgi:hypothetical protein